MFERPTTFVIGAGASCELGLPSGDALKSEICKLLGSEAGDRKIATSFIDEINSRDRRMGIHPADGREERSRLASQIRTGLPLAPSIDNFLYSRGNDEKLVEFGKGAIAYRILEAERRSLFFPTHINSRLSGDRPRSVSLDNPKIRDTWYYPLVQHLFAQTTLQDVKGHLEKIRFIIFNYDRCLEQFLLLALRGHFGVDENTAADILEAVEFVHPYGSLGPLPWQSQGGHLQFAAQANDRLDVFEIGQSLRTFTESTSSDAVSKIHDAMGLSETLCFLGFGFLRQNLDLLRTPNSLATNIFSTAYGISAVEYQNLKQTLSMFRKKHYTADAKIEPGTCSDFFGNYRITLAGL
ncbi:MAG: hypothetical protein ABJ242_10920 [Marinomonas sp.]